MKRLIFWIVFQAVCLVVNAQEPNYDETKVLAYTLPNPLKMDNGKIVDTREKMD